MSIDKIEIEQIATLAKLHLAADAARSYETDLTGILALVEQMDGVDTEGIVPLAHPLEITARLRADTVTEGDLREHFQDIAPLVASGHYLVPKVIE